MPEFTAHDGQFWLDDQPLLIQAGEFHYFRTPADQWRHRLGRLLDAGFNTVAAYIPWLWHQWAEGQSDLDGHSHPLRDLAGFLDLAAEMGFWIIARPGPYIMAETINEGIPPWVFSRYPQAAYISQGGAVQNIASYLHPDFLACVRDWYRAVFAVLTPRQVTRGGRILLVQLDNEMGMIQWVRNILDANPDTVSRLASFVRDRYGDAVTQRYAAGSLPELLRAALLDPAAPSAGRVVEDYRAFYRVYLRDYTAWLWSEAQANGLDVPPVVNIHGFANGGKTFPIGLSQLIEALRLPGVIAATDVYPMTIGEGSFHQLLLLNEITKAVQNPDQPLFSIEFQSGGIGDFDNGQASFYDLHTRLCLAGGMRAINHYLFCSGENDPLLSPVRRHDWGHPVRMDGRVRRHYYRYGRLSRVLAAYGRALILARPQPVTRVGFLLDYFMTEVNNTFTQERARTLTHQREAVLFDLLGRSLALSHRPFDALDLERQDLDPATTPLCWVMLEQQCPAPLQHKLVDYLRAGGRLILAGRLCVEDFDGQPCTVLQDALGVTAIHSDPPFTESAIDAFGYAAVPAWFVETYEGEFEEVFAARHEQTVGFVQTVGQGQAMFLGAAMTVSTLEDLDIIQRMALRFDCAPAFDLSQWADIHLSRGPEGSFLFLNNYQDDSVETTIAYQGQPLLGGLPVHLAARQGVILPLDWQVRPGLTVHYATAEINGLTETAHTLTLSTARPTCEAELTLSGYRCAADCEIVADHGNAQRVKLRATNGQIVLIK